MLPERDTAPPPPLQRRTPGAADLRVFTTEPIPAGRHRLHRGRALLRVVRDASTGRPVLRLAVSALVAALVCGCGGGAVERERPDPTVGGVGSLSGVCPDRVVVQAAWYPTVDVGLPFQLLGGDWSIDARRKRVSGSLVADGKDTGVDVEFRSGGEKTGFQTAPAVAYADRSVTLALTNIDEIVGLSATQPMTAVMAPLNGDPQVLIWDPVAHPDFNILPDIGQTDTPVLSSVNASTVFGYLTGSGILRASQLDTSYDGTPSQFLASRGRVVVQGYATNEPHLYETLPGWGRPVRYALIQDTAYPNYANVLAVRTGDRDRLDGCLRRLVPILQRAQAQFMADPGPALSRIVRAVAAFRVGFTYDRSAAEYGACQLRALGLVSNTISGVLGGFDTSKLQRMIDITRPVFAAQRRPVKDPLTPADIATGDYLDPTTALPASPTLRGLNCTPRRSTR